MKQDIQERKDIELLVNTFYNKVKVNETIGFIFNDIAQVDWDTHLPKMHRFWASMLLGERSFRGNPMVKHFALSEKTPMTETQFSEWLRLFHETCDELYEGSLVNEAKKRASTIAQLMMFKIQSFAEI